MLLAFESNKGAFETLFVAVIEHNCVHALVYNSVKQGLLKFGWRLVRFAEVDGGAGFELAGRERLARHVYQLAFAHCYRLAA
ncbi:hypothetical protein BpHYR1_029237 [Brachionus plicatilis]|uniref:Uncharacterized protein n=1 Tax=Brachionus plicatilis TaxID=10195 RepID=A0A3M7S4M7_BRAPC|nr:hypothetical protein BpHYR1_029237 [Brachionus plicatilis]